MSGENSQHKFKMCPFRQGHYCGTCELLNQETQQCVFKLINWNLGAIAKGRDKMKPITRE